MSQRNEIADLLSGILLVFGMHILAIIICGVLNSLLITLLGPNPVSTITYVLVISLLGIGISQLVYVVPVIFLLKRQGQWGVMKGVIIGAVITALLNGGCWLLFAWPR